MHAEVHAGTVLNYWILQRFDPEVRFCGGSDSVAAPRLGDIPLATAESAHQQLNSRIPPILLGWLGVGNEHSPAWGKPAQPIVGVDDGPIEVTVVRYATKEDD